MKVKHIILVLLFFVFFEEPIYAQEKHEYGFQANVHYGFLIRHHNYIGHLVQGHVKAAEFSFFEERTGKKLWEQLYKYPQAGITFSYFDLANPKQLGNLYGLYPYINFPFKKNEDFSFNLKVGSGISYVTKKFETIENHKNTAIGSHFNSLIILRLNSQVRIYKTLLWEAGLGITHFSNGAFQMPNLGLNIVSVSTGFAFSSPGKNYIADTIMPVEKIKEFNIEIGAGFSEKQPIGGRKYSAVVISVNRLKQISHKSKLGYGADVFYNSTNIPIMEEDSIFIKSKIQNIQPGAKFCYELILDRLSIPLEMGVYVYSKLKSNGPVYNLFGLKYEVSKNITAAFILKTHFAKADFIQMRLGYKFN